jgi:hypothetical protein
MKTGSGRPGPAVGVYSGGTLAIFNGVFADAGIISTVTIQNAIGTNRYTDIIEHKGLDANIWHLLNSSGGETNRETVSPSQA